MRFRCLSILLALAMSSCVSVATPTRSASSTPRPTVTASHVPSITPIPCLSWSQITPEMEGDDICVYGTVKKHKENKDIAQTFFYFGTTEQFFITSLYRWNEPQEDICMRANGVIQLNTYKVPYIKIGETLYPCGSMSAAPASTKPAQIKPPSTSTQEPAQFTSGSRYSAYEMTAQVELTQSAWDDEILALEARETQNASVAASCNIKGNISFDGEKIYHVPGGEFYSATVIDEAYGERWFCSEEEARANGWRRSYK